MAILSSIGVNGGLSPTGCTSYSYSTGMIVGLAPSRGPGSEGATGGPSFESFPPPNPTNTHVF